MKLKEKLLRIILTPLAYLVLIILAVFMVLVHRMSGSKHPLK